MQNKLFCNDKIIWMKKTITIGVLLIMILSMISCTANKIKADNLMENIKSTYVESQEIDDKFIDSTANFSVELFKKSYSKTDNSLISPLSILLATAMTANGAGNETLSQIVSVIGGDLTLDELNKYLYSYVKTLPNEEKSKLEIANSIWFRDNNFKVNNEFLQTNANYYGADAYKTAFNKQSITDMNNWIDNKTDGLIKRIVYNFDEDDVLFLINTVLFDAEWQKIYRDTNVKSDKFTNLNNENQTMQFMNSNEYKYLENENCTGFVKSYKNNNYSFAAFLPNKNIDIKEFVNSLTGEEFINILNNQMTIRVEASLPKFNYEYNIALNEIFYEMGITDAFSINADFEKMGTMDKKLYLGKILHKTKISVTQLGTKAGAATREKTVESSKDYKVVKLNRPFVYSIIDNETKLPIFIGALQTK